MIIFLIGLIFGLALGSFVKLLADRSLTNKSFLGRSSCPNCHHKLAWYDLVPIVSYIILKGRCRYCHYKIPIEYLLVELVLGGLIGLLFYYQFSSPLHIDLTSGLIQPGNLAFFKLLLETIIKAGAICVFVAVMLTDLKTGLIPDRITYPAIILAFIMGFLLHLYNSLVLYLSWQNSLIGKYLLPPYSNYIWQRIYWEFEPWLYSLLAALVVFLFFGVLIFVTKGRGMGGGDLKLGVYMGLVLGLANTLIALFLAFFLGSIVATFLLILGKKKFGQTIPFGPFLSFGSIIALFWGQKLLLWYLHIRM